MNDRELFHHIDRLTTEVGEAMAKIDSMVSADGFVQDEVRTLALEGRAKAEEVLRLIEQLPEGERYAAVKRDSESIASMMLATERYLSGGTMQ